MAFPLNFIPNSGSQTERALRKYFLDHSAKPDSSRDDGGIFVTLEQATRQSRARTIRASEAIDDTPFTGNLNWIVTIIDQFPALEQGTTPEAARVAMDKQVGKMMYWMSQTADQRTLLATAKNITDAGRSLAPTHLIITACGTAAAKGRYDRTDDTHWDHVSSDHHIIYNDTDHVWELQDPSAVVLYTCDLDNFPTGTWVKPSGGGNTPVPKVQDEPEWADADMSNFTCMFVVPAGQMRGEGKDDEGISDATWREVRRFTVKSCSRAVIGYSNTEGA